MGNIAKPTKQQLDWHELELGVLIHYCLKMYRPDAICFQGPKAWPQNVRWVGNEDGLAPENCWATTNAGDARFNGTIPEEQAGVGDPNGRYYWPAETDMPNRTHAAFGGGWSWQPNEEHLCYMPEQLLDCYIRSVGRKLQSASGHGDQPGRGFSG